MKKIIAFGLMFVLIISLFGCGKPTVEDACNQAANLLAKCNNENEWGLTLKGKYDASATIYIVNARYASFDASAGATDYVLTKMTQEYLNGEVYPQLKNIFQDFNVAVGITLSDSNGQNAFSMILDGEVTYTD